MRDTAIYKEICSKVGHRYTSLAKSTTRYITENQAGEVHVFDGLLFCSTCGDVQHLQSVIVPKSEIHPLMGKASATLDD